MRVRSGPADARTLRARCPCIYIYGSGQTQACALWHLWQDADAGLRRDAARALTAFAARELGARDALRCGAVPILLVAAGAGTAPVPASSTGGASPSAASSDDGSPSAVRAAALDALAAVVSHECGR